MPHLSGQPSTAVIPLNIYCFILSWSIYKLESVRCIKRDNSPSVRTLSGLISLFPCPYADLPVGKAVGWSQRCTWCSVTCAELWAYLPYIADIFLQGVRRHLGFLHVTCVMWWHNMVNPACLLYRACSDAWLQHCNTELLWQISQRSTYPHLHSLHLYMAVWFRTEIFWRFFSINSSLTINQNYSLHFAMQQLNQFIKLKHILINSKKYNSLPSV